MSARPTPVPEFCFSITPFTNEDTGEASRYVVIEANVLDYSNGVLLLDEIHDVLLLRDAIDEFIVKHNLKKKTLMKKKQKTDNAKPGWCILLEGYLKGYAPAPVPGGGVILRTSTDIVNDLSDMMDISENTVTSVMAQLGFRPHFDESGAHGWMMRRDPLAVHDIPIVDPDDGDE